MKERGLLHRSPPRAPELHQATKLFELLPQRPNDLWQMDVTYIHIPGHGWWYAVTVIDYYSRYLLATNPMLCHQGVTLSPGALACYIFRFVSRPQPLRARLPPRAWHHPGGVPARDGAGRPVTSSPVRSFMEQSA
jgi:hypothetical protein